MPTLNPRLTITLEPTLAAQLRRLSELTGNSQSKLIAELLEGSTEVFDRLIRLLEAAHTAKDSLRSSTVKDLEAAQAKVEQQLGLALDTMDTASMPLLKQAEVITRRAARGSRGALRSGAPGATAPKAAPPSNRGVRSTNPKTKVHRKGRNDGPL